MNMLKHCLAAMAAVCTASAALAGSLPCESALTLSEGQYMINVPCMGGQRIDDDCADTSVNNTWFRFTAPVSCAYRFDTSGTPTAFNTVLNIFSACQRNLDLVRLGCNDDVGQNDTTSRLELVLSAGQTVFIAVGGYNAGDCGSANLNITNLCACCDPWDNGRPDGRGGQTSSLGADADWRPMVNVAFDDFWLCEGNIYTINTVRGTMSTNSALPKFIVAILPDCNGRPDIRKPLAVAGLRGTRFAVDEDDAPFIIGDVTFEDTGSPDADGFRPIQVTASFGVPSRVADNKRLILKGGAYWVTFIGFSAALNPLDEFFWSTTGNQVIKGRSGQFFDGDELRGSEELCCGCTDYNFCVEGRSCKILLDNGGPQQGDFLGIPGTPSLQNGSNAQTRSRAADRFVVPPCRFFRPCYIEAWLWTNCDRAGLQFWTRGCSCPPDGPIPPVFIESDCVMKTGVTVTEGSAVLELKKFQFYLDRSMLAVESALGGPMLRGGFNVWVSVFGLGDNRQNARAYFAFNERCERECDLSFGPGCYRPAPADQNLWRSTAAGPTVNIGGGRDYAFLVAVDDLRPPNPPVVTAACPADANSDGSVTVQDLFDYLAAWFVGCP